MLRHVDAFFMLGSGLPRGTVCAAMQDVHRPIPFGEGCVI